MAEWDSGALAHLEDITGRLAGLEVPSVMAKLVGGVFRRNLQRHEPTENGDTAQGLAWLCAINISQLAHRHYADPAATRSGQIRAALPDTNALVVRACGVTLRVRKAPGDTLNPAWSKFTWHEADGVGRHLAAAANTAVYRPAESDQDGRSTTLDTGELWSLDEPTALLQVMLTWAGDMDTGLTAGWLGFPCTGAPSWFAVTQLWRDEPAVGAVPADASPISDDSSDNFADQPEPRIQLGLRHEQPGRSGQA
jgi:hypothetical protein